MVYSAVANGRQPNLYAYNRGGGTHLSLALIVLPLTTHPFRGGASFLLLAETPPTFGRRLG